MDEKLRGKSNKTNEEIPYEELSLRNSFMFGKVMTDKSLCIQMLECLTGNTIDDINEIVIEKTDKTTYDSRGVRYDVYVEDSDDRIYDAEMQNETSDIKKELPKRSRFYQSIIDVSALEKGMHHSTLKNSYVIFICTFDPFGYGDACYSYSMSCEERPELKLKDGRLILFFNTKGDLSTLPPKTTEFLEYIETGNKKGDFADAIDRAVINARQNAKFKGEYMKTLLHDYDVRYEGIEIGRSEGIEIGKGEGLEALVTSLKDFYSDFDKLYEKVISNKAYKNTSKEDVLKYF